MCFLNGKTDKPKTVEIAGKPDSSVQIKQTQVIQKKNIGENVQKLIRYASTISNNNFGFVQTLDKESAGTWSISVKNKNKNGTTDIGICQFNSAYHSAYIKSPEFKDPYNQIRTCWAMYSDYEKRGILDNRFYAHRAIWQNKGLFELINL